ncbi:MAG: sulfatase-like hydrolase/transferase [Desulfobacterales bacterium]|nr:sulfatase-like hydrolase/transferase [Desulfobacterales bacterium]
MSKKEKLKNNIILYIFFECTLFFVVFDWFFTRDFNISASNIFILFAGFLLSLLFWISLHGYTIFIKLVFPKLWVFIPVFFVSFFMLGVSAQREYFVTYNTLIEKDLMFLLLDVPLYVFGLFKDTMNGEMLFFFILAVCFLSFFWIKRVSLIFKNAPLHKLNYQGSAKNILSKRFYLNIIFVFIACFGFYAQIRWSFKHDLSTLPFRLFQVILCLFLLMQIIWIIFHFKIVFRFFNKYIFIFIVYLFSSVIFWNQTAFINFAPMDQQFSHLLWHTIIANKKRKSLYNPKRTQIQEKLKLIESKSPAFNILIILSESLRRDHVGGMGYSRKATPFLDRWMSRCLVFPYCVGTTSSTNTAMPTLFTGLAPGKSIENYQLQPLLWDYFPKSMKTFFITGQSLGWFHLDDYLKTESLDYLFESRTIGVDDHNKGIDDSIVIERAKDHLKNLRQEGLKHHGFLGVVQFANTHYPYYYPEEFKVFRPARYTKDKTKLIELINHYDNAVRYQDHLIQNLIDYMDRAGFLEDTIIIFTSDHGEAFNEHGKLFHVVSHYQEMIAVPMFIFIPEEVKNILSLRGLKMLEYNTGRDVTNLDIVPTVLDLYGILDNGDGAFIENLDGRSLLRKIPNDRVIFVAGTIQNFQTHSRDFALIMDHIAIQARPGLSGYTIEIYDLQKDPLEQNNLYPAFPKEIYSKMIELGGEKFGYVKLLTNLK